MGINHLWRVTCIKTAQKVPVGLAVEIVISGRSSAPNAKEIKAAIKTKFGIEVGECHCHKGYFEMVDMSKR